WRPATTACDLARSWLVDLDIQDVRRAFANGLQVVDTIKIEVKNDAESSPQRSRDQPGPRSGSNEREFWQLELYRTRGRALADQQDVIEGFAAFERGLHKDAKVFLDFRLADVFRKLRRAQARIELALFV